MFVCCLMNDRIASLTQDEFFIFIETVYFLFAMLAISDTAAAF